MHFPTIQFFIFFIIVLLFSHLLRGKSKGLKIFLLVASYFFYGTFDIRFVLVLFSSTLFNYLFGKLIQKNYFKLGRLFLSLAVISNVLVLFIFKYFDFFRIETERLAHNFGLELQLPILLILIPIGISFFTFRNISYVVDLFKNKIETKHNFIDYSLFIAFFPQILSGPLMRAEDFFLQLSKQPVENINYKNALGRFLLGLFKKLVIATYLSENIVNPAFAVPENNSVISLWLGMYAYAIVIYADFSGYTDMSIAVSSLLGFQTPENFDKPYFAQNIQEFWRRWHITLSNWIRDYVYIPLGGSRKGKIRTVINILITFALTGLWHGVGGTYIVWGLIHGVLLAFMNIFKKDKKEDKNIIFKIVSIIFTFNLVCFSWIFFNSSTIDSAFKYIQHMFVLTNDFSFDLNVLILIIAGLVLQATEKYIINFYAKIFGNLRLIFHGIIWGLLLLIIIQLGPDTVPDFIYYGF